MNPNHPLNEELLSGFQDAWEKDSPKLFLRTIQLTGGKFAQVHQSVTVHRCAWLLGWSNPTIFSGAIFFLDPMDVDFKYRQTIAESLLMHELLHPFVIKLLWPQFQSSLLKKYASESTITLFHLHLFALQKAVLISTGEQDQWTIVKRFLKRASHSFDRALEIVDLEGENTFVAELKAASEKHSTNAPTMRSAKF